MQIKLNGFALFRAFSVDERRRLRFHPSIKRAGILSLFVTNALLRSCVFPSQMYQMKSVGRLGWLTYIACIALWWCAAISVGKNCDDSLQVTITLRKMKHWKKKVPLPDCQQQIRANKDKLTDMLSLDQKASHKNPSTTLEGHARKENLTIPSVPTGARSDPQMSKHNSAQEVAQWSPLK